VCLSLSRGRVPLASRHGVNFEVHRLLGPAIRDWYSTLAVLDSGRVVWGYPDEMPRLVTRSRFDVELFDRWIAALPGQS
jgi:hypothetical protein